MGDMADGVGKSSLSTYELHNWIVNGVIALPFLCVTGMGLVLLVFVALETFGVVQTSDDASGHLGGFVLALLWTALSYPLSARALTRGVVASPSGLRVKKVFKTWDIAWRDIARIQLRVDSGEDQMTWYSPVVAGSFRTTDLDLPIASSNPLKAARFVERLNETLAAQRGGTRP